MLASIQKVIAIDPIDNADAIEVATVLGWKCVVRKNSFNVNDLCVYIEIDTIIPKKFIDDSAGDEKHRLRTIKLRGQISQGLVLPLSVLPEDKYSVGDDVTSILGIEKFEKAIPANLQGLVKRYFPPFLHKTDEERVQSNTKLLSSLYGKPYYISTKVDGTSSTYYKYQGEYGVCSRNMELKESDGNVYWIISRKYNLDSIPEGVCIQGEIAGPGIQDNKLGLKEFDLFVFNVFDINAQKYLPYEQLIKFCWTYGLRTVPILVVGDNFSIEYTQDSLLEMANELRYDSGKLAEGIVVRSLDQSISFKVVSNKFLLKNNE